MMSNCNGNGICVNGYCNCQDGYIGADCSLILTPVDTSTNMMMSLDSHDYVYLNTLKNARSDLILTLKSQD